jgi:CRP-like cAMP-binding protein/Fe-S-cluster-containing dehydrogenase component/ferredoxin
MSDVTLTIDGVQVTVPAGTTVFDAARMNGIDIPTLCHQQNEVPVGVCRVCVVEVEKARVLQASCVRPAENGMVVHTNSDRVRGPRRTLIEMLMADHPSPCRRQQQSGDCELEALARQTGVGEPRFPHRISRRGQDDSSPVIFVDHEACILCDRCIRGCDETKSFNVLGRRGKGFEAGIAFDLDNPMGNSSCRSCGECMTCCPTGALTNKAVVETVLPQGEPVEVQTLLSLPYFEDVSGTFLELNKKAVVVRRFNKGDIICREGEYGSTAFYILEGTVDVFLASEIGHVKSSGGATGFFSRLTSRLAGRAQDRRPEESARRSIPIDASVDLPYENPVAQLHAGDLFGEMTCMSLYPRSATVRAATDCVMLEMLRNVLDIMLRDKNLRARLEDNYKKRALEDHLRSVPMFAALTPEFIATLRENVQLVRYNKGDVIVRQGDLADAFYLIRIGFVKVTEQYPGGDLTLAYLGRGGYFGEMGLLGEGRRTATCTAMDHVEVVRIGAEDFHRMMREFPEVRAQLEATAETHRQQNRERLATISHVPLTQFLERGLFEAQSLLVLDLEKCTRCDQCTRACADAHDGVTRLIREGLRFDHYLVATSCRQCRDPLCMVGCPVGSIRRRNSLEVIIEDWCTGCGLCARNCPYGNITMHVFPESNGQKARKKATSCDLCTEHAEPSCVYACPHDAAHRVEPNSFFKHIVGRAENFGTLAAPQ